MATTRFTELKQSPDDSWVIVTELENGMVKVETVQALTKEQAIRETLRRGYKNLRVWDKQVLAAVASGTVKLDRSVFE